MMKYLFILLFLISIFSTALLYPKTTKAQTDIPWTTAGANAQRTSWTAAEAPGDLKALWVKRFVPYISQKVQVIGAENKVFVATSRGVYAFDSDTGNQLWVYSTELPIGHSPTYDNGTVYAAGLDRKIHAINAVNGTKKWVFDASSEGGAGFAVSPLVAEGKVFAGNRDGKMYAVNKVNGSLVWKFATDGTGPILFSAAYSNGKIFFGSQDGNAYALTTSGALSWKKKLPGMGFISWWPVIYNDKVIFTRTEEARNPSNDLTGALNFTDEKVLFSDSDESGNPYGQIITRTIGSQTKAVDVSINPDGENTIPDYLTQNPYQRNVFILSQSDGTENSKIPPLIRSVQDWETTYPPTLSGYIGQNILYFRNPIFESGAFPGSMLTGWEYNTNYFSLVMSEASGGSPDLPLDEPTGFSGGGRYLYYNLCCDRHMGVIDVSKPNSFPTFDSSRQWRILKGAIGENSEYLPDNYFSQASKFFWGDPSAGKNGGRFYASHGDNIGPAVYDGKLFVIRSNALIAFSPTGTDINAPVTDVALPSKIDEFAGIPDVNSLKTSLESEVQKIVNSGHLKPGYGLTGNFDFHSDTELGDELQDYWHTPGDLHYVLLRAMPYLSTNLKSQLKTYLTTEFNTYPPYQYSHIGWKDGSFRESFSWPPLMASKIADYGPKTSTKWNWGNDESTLMWSWPPQQMYAMWLYAKENPSQALTIFNSAKNKLPATRPSYCSPKCPEMWPQAVNGLIAGYKGYVELAKLANQPVSAYSTYETTLNSLLTERKDGFTKTLIQTLGETGTNNPANYYATLIHAWNFMYMTPSLGDYLNTNKKAAVQDAVNTYTAQIPMWFEAFNREVQGEGGASPYQQTHSLFQAKALILKEDYNSLAKYIDVPMMKGDLYYIDNLIAAIEVSGNTTPPTGSNPSPTPAPLLGDINLDNIVNIQDYILLSNSFGTANPEADLDGNAIVNIQDYILLSNNFGKTLTTTIAPTPGTVTATPPLTSAKLTAGSGLAFNSGATLPDSVKLASMRQEAVNEAFIEYKSKSLQPPKLIMIINNSGEMAKVISEITNKFNEQFPGNTLPPITGTGTSNPDYNAFENDAFVEHQNSSLSVLLLGGNSIEKVFMAKEAINLPTPTGPNSESAYFYAGQKLGITLKPQINPLKKNIIYMFGPGHNPKMTELLNGMKTPVALDDPVAGHIKIIGSAAYVNGSSIYNNVQSPSSVTAVLIQGNFQTALSGKGVVTNTTDINNSLNQIKNELSGNPDVLFFVPGHPAAGTYDSIRNTIASQLGSTPIFGHEGGGEYGHLNTPSQPIAVPNHYFMLGLKGN